MRLTLRLTVKTLSRRLWSNVASLNYAHLHWQALKSIKLWSIICCHSLHCQQNPIKYSDSIWHEKRMHEKTRISDLCFGNWCTMRDLTQCLWPYTCSANYVECRGRVIRRWRSRTTWLATRIIPSMIGASVYIDLKPVKFRRSTVWKSRNGGGFFDLQSIKLFRGIYLCQFQRMTLNAEVKTRVSWMQVLKCCQLKL